MDKHIMAIPSDLAGIGRFLQKRIKDPSDGNLWVPLMHEFEKMKVLLAEAYKLLYGGKVYGHRPLIHFRSLSKRVREDKIVFGQLSERITHLKHSMEENKGGGTAAAYIHVHGHVIKEISKSLRTIINCVDKSALPHE